MQETINKIRREVAKLHKSLNIATSSLRLIAVESKDPEVENKVREAFKKINETMGG